jgi:hypothetical protein
MVEYMSAVLGAVNVLARSSTTVMLTYSGKCVKQRVKLKARISVILLC